MCQCKFINCHKCTTLACSLTSLRSLAKCHLLKGVFLDIFTYKSIISSPVSGMLYLPTLFLFVTLITTEHYTIYSFVYCLSAASELKLSNNDKDFVYFIFNAHVMCLAHRSSINCSSKQSNRK